MQGRNRIKPLIQGWMIVSVVLIVNQFRDGVLPLPANYDILLFFIVIVTERRLITHRNLLHGDKWDLRRNENVDILVCRTNV